MDDREGDIVTQRQRRLKRGYTDPHLTRARCVRVYVCMSATFVARLVAIKDEDGDTCLVVFG